MLPKGQDWIISRMKKMGYPSDDGGVCFGIAIMAMQAFLVNDLKTFNKRLQIIKAV
jgi:hypothetical protein